MANVDNEDLPDEPDEPETDEPSEPAKGLRTNGICAVEVVPGVYDYELQPEHEVYTKIVPIALQAPQTDQSLGNYRASNAIRLCPRRESATPGASGLTTLHARPKAT